MLRSHLRAVHDFAEKKMIARKSKQPDIEMACEDWIQTFQLADVLGVQKFNKALEKHMKRT